VFPSGGPGVRRRPYRSRIHRYRSHPVALWVLGDWFSCSVPSGLVLLPKLGLQVHSATNGSAVFLSPLGPGVPEARVMGQVPPRLRFLLVPGIGIHPPACPICFSPEPWGRGACGAPTHSPALPRGGSSHSVVSWWWAALPALFARIHCPRRGGCVHPRLACPGCRYCGLVGVALVHGSSLGCSSVGSGYAARRLPF